MDATHDTHTQWHVHSGTCTVAQPRNWDAIDALRQRLHAGFAGIDEGELAGGIGVTYRHPWLGTCDRSQEETSFSPTCVNLGVELRLENCWGARGDPLPVGVLSSAIVLLVRQVRQAP